MSCRGVPHHASRKSLQWHVRDRGARSRGMQVTPKSLDYRPCVKTPHWEQGSQLAVGPRGRGRVGRGPRRASVQSGTDPALSNACSEQGPGPRPPDEVPAASRRSPTRGSGLRGAEGVGFEPTEPIGLNGFRDRPIRPLSHPSGIYRSRPVRVPVGERRRTCQRRSAKKRVSSSAASAACTPGRTMTS
jgi:hypothetical protein